MTIQHPELLPCPFCGVGIERAGQLVRHPENGCILQQLGWPVGRIAAWNTRPLPEPRPTPSADVVERVARAMKPNLFSPHLTPESLEQPGLQIARDEVRRLARLAIDALDLRVGPRMCVEAMTEAADRIESLQTKVERLTWQPIETAPRDGSVFLSYEPDQIDGGVDFAEWCGDIEEFVRHGCGWDRCTHWMPLPAPPALDSLKDGSEPA